MTKDQPIEQFLDQLASKSATPGGGGAAAIMGAMGAALVSMVCNLTIGKKRYQDVEAELQSVLDRAEALRAQLTSLSEADVEVFDHVMAAYKMPKSNDQQRTTRLGEIQQALKAATDVPLACARASAEVIALSQSVAENGNLNVISDAGVAVLAGYAALKSAALNVQININNIEDQAFCESRSRELAAILDGCGDNTEAIYQLVKGKL